MTQYRIRAGTCGIMWDMGVPCICDPARATTYLTETEARAAISLLPRIVADQAYVELVPQEGPVCRIYVKTQAGCALVESPVPVLAQMPGGPV